VHGRPGQHGGEEADGDRNRPGHDPGDEKAEPPGANPQGAVGRDGDSLAGLEGVEVGVDAEQTAAENIADCRADDEESL
jgi:hypothetical protein